MHTFSDLSSREQSVDHSEYLQVPSLLSPDCNGTTFHFPDHCYDEAPLTSFYHNDQEEEEVEEVNKILLMLVQFNGNIVTSLHAQKLKMLLLIIQKR